jgi:hypothetical protein
LTNSGIDFDLMAGSVLGIMWLSSVEPTSQARLASGVVADAD